MKTTNMQPNDRRTQSGEKKVLFIIKLYCFMNYSFEKFTEIFKKSTYFAICERLF